MGCVTEWGASQNGVRHRMGCVTEWGALLNEVSH